MYENVISSFKKMVDRFIKPKKEHFKPNLLNRNLQSNRNMIKLCFRRAVCGIVYSLQFPARFNRQETMDWFDI